eukprot:gnl/TRDRNA2_/TRDRNA2_85316_c0_seq1.p1 gnl/TRDRNA2_/TRDRNA2_85316_c0~~gnl/TRDRNA2_/TRDRNA2_85316_c0_seq1.p1  ORF type:complete len:189 (+),score=52.41 gnl/TRDRNA2_/TRDRNA2_85316_c0_seq1:364-930(+)
MQKKLPGVKEQMENFESSGTNNAKNYDASMSCMFGAAEGVGEAKMKHYFKDNRALKEELWQLHKKDEEAGITTHIAIRPPDQPSAANSATSSRRGPHAGAIMEESERAAATAGNNGNEGGAADPQVREMAAALESQGIQYSVATYADDLQGGGPRVEHVREGAAPVVSAEAGRSPSAEEARDELQQVD